MFDYRRLLLWLVVVLVPGGLLLLPVLIADIRRSRAKKAVSDVPPSARPLAA